MYSIAVSLAVYLCVDLNYSIHIYVRLEKKEKNGPVEIYLKIKKKKGWNRILNEQVSIEYPSTSMEYTECETSIVYIHRRTYVEREREKQQIGWELIPACVLRSDFFHSSIYLSIQKNGFKDDKCTIV